MVVKDAADAAGFLAVRQVEIVVAPFLVSGVVRDPVVAAAGGLHRGMKRNRVGVLLGPPPIEHRRQVRAAAEPCLRRYHKACVHVHGRDVRIAHVRDHRNAGGPEPGIIGGAWNLRAKFGAEFAVHGRAVHADLLEQPPVHHRHHAAAARLSGVVVAVPGRAHEASRAAGVERCRGVVFQPLESRADVVAQRFEPASGASLAIVDHGHIHGGFLTFILRHCEERKRRSNPFFVVAMDCFAEFIIGRAFARPGGSQ